MDKSEYLGYIDRLIGDIDSYNMCDYEYTMRQLSSDTYTEVQLIEFDIFRRKHGIEGLYGLRELIPKGIDYGAVLNLNLFEVYHDSLLYLGEVEFVPIDFNRSFVVDDEELSYDSTECGYYKVGYGEMRGNSNLFFDIKNKKLITMEGSDFDKLKQD